MKKSFKDLYAWLKNPDDIELPLSTGGKFQITCQLLLFQLLVAVPFVGLITLIHHHVIKLESPLYDWSLFETILLIVVLVPLIEEFFFRFPLKYKRNYLARFINSLSPGWLEKRWNWIFKYFLFLLAFAFGIIHLTNFTNTGIVFFALFPVIVGSQMIGGLLLSYSRIKFGFIWSWFQHGAYNFILILATVLFLHNQEIINFSEEKLSIEIRELQFIDKTASSYATSYCTDCEEGLIYSVEGENISLYGLIDSLGLEGSKPYDNAWINVKIKSDRGITKKEIGDILRKEIKFDSE